MFSKCWRLWVILAVGIRRYAAGPIDRQAVSLPDITHSYEDKELKNNETAGKEYEKGSFDSYAGVRLRMMAADQQVSNKERACVKTCASKRYRPERKECCRRYDSRKGLA